MDAREQKGLQIAALCKIGRKDGHWVVPSQSGQGRYQVHLDPDAPRCNCPDFENRRQKCKHIFAVEFVVERERHADGTETVTRSVTIKERITYRQDWPAYNKAQTGEKKRFQELLAELCRGLPSLPPSKGRQRLPLADMVFAATFKVYSTVSGRRFMCDLADAQAKGHIDKVPHFNSIFNYLLVTQECCTAGRDNHSDMVCVLRTTS